MSIQEAWEHEQPQLMPVPTPFDGYVELPARVSSTSLVSAARNRYSVPCALAGHRVSVRLYPERVMIVADQSVVAEHARASDRDHVVYDWQHYLPLIERKPGALRNGAPFADLPAPLQRLRRTLLRRDGGDRVMAQVLSAVPGFAPSFATSRSKKPRRMTGLFLCCTENRSIAAASGRRDAGAPQGQVPVVVLRAQARPLGSTLTSRSWGPGGLRRHTVKTAVSEPTPVGWKLSVSRVDEMLRPEAAAFSLSMTSELAPPATQLMPSLLRQATIQPCSHPPAPQFTPSAETHSVTTVLRLMASLRVAKVAATRLLAAVRNWLPRNALWNDGTAMDSKIAITTRVIISSMSEKPRASRAPNFIAPVLIISRRTSTPSHSAPSA